MDSQDRHNQPGPGYHDLPPGQETPADQQPDAVQSKAEQQQQDLPQAQPHLQTNQPYPPYAFGVPPQPQQQQPTGVAYQHQNYGMPPHFQHMSYGGYNFPPPPSQHGCPITPAAPHLRDGSQPPESQPRQLQHDQGQQFQPGAPQDFQQNPPQQFQQVPDLQQGEPQQFLQGAPQQVQHGNQQYGAPPHYPGFPPQQYPYWGHSGPMPGYPPQFFSGPMMQSNSHELTPEPTLKASTPHRGHSDSPAAPPDQAVQQHGTYPMPPMMGGFPYPGPAHPYYNHPAPSMPPAVPPAAQPTPEPPKPVPSPSPLAASDHTSPLHDPTSSRSRSPTLPSPAPPHHQPQPAPPATTTAQPPAPPSCNEDTTNATRTTALRLLHTTTTTPTTPPPPYGPGATDPAYACSPETARLHRQTPGASVHAVRHTRDCGRCGSRRGGRKSKGKKGGCDRLWPCGACVEKDGRWGGCRYVMTGGEGDGDGHGGEGEGRADGGVEGGMMAKAMGLPAGAADVLMTDADAAETQENVAAPPLPGSAPLDPALDAAPTPAAGLVSVQLPPDVLQQLLGNPQVLAALRESGYAGDERALGGAEAAAPRTPLGQEQRSSPSGGQQDSSPQDERTIGSDGPMTLAQLAAVRREGGGEGEKEG